MQRCWPSRRGRGTCDASVAADHRTDSRPGRQARRPFARCSARCFRSWTSPFVSGHSAPWTRASSTCFTLHRDVQSALQARQGTVACQGEALCAEVVDGAHQDVDGRPGLVQVRPFDQCMRTAAAGTEDDRGDPSIHPLGPTTDGSRPLIRAHARATARAIGVSGWTSSGSRTMPTSRSAAKVGSSPAIDSSSARSSRSTDSRVSPGTVRRSRRRRQRSG
jgi:hypothetical protein